MQIPMQFDGVEIPAAVQAAAAQIAPIERAKRQRDRILTASAEKAGDAFREAARAFVVAYLEQHGPTAGEVLVDECRAAGIVPANGMDARAFGPVFLRLSQRKTIRVCGQVQRVKGHKTGGGNIWALTQK